MVRIAANVPPGWVRSEKSMADQPRVNVIFPGEMYEELRRIAYEKRTTIPEIIRLYCQEGIIRAEEQGYRETNAPASRREEGEC